MEQKDIQRYFGDLKFRLSIYEKAKKEMDTYIASDFNVFEYIQPKENRLSEIIADLLDVKGKHGQKDTFLKQFIKQLGIEFAHKLENCKIKREDATTYIVNNKRRIDITLNFDNEFEIGIENKPWDGEQPDQLADYQKHMSKKHGKEYCIIYLSGDGSLPVSIEKKLRQRLLAEKKLIVLNYKVDMVMWLESCYKVCEAEKIRFFIKDFMTYIKQNFENIDEEMKGNENE